MSPILSLLNVLLVVSTRLLSNTVLADLADRRSTTTNCTAPGSTPCGPAPACCSSGYADLYPSSSNSQLSAYHPSRDSLTCNYRRGIPFCEDDLENRIEGYDRSPCLDPYLFRCDEIVEIPGFCCPTGTSCFNNGIDNVVQCVNALGTTAAAIPSSTTGVIPSATPFTAADTSIVYSPSAGTWKTVDSPGNCTISNSIRVTQDVNASISFNYTGTSIMIHTVTSSIGGSVWLIVDGFNTTSSVNTLSGPDDDTRPTCYPNQYPPFVITPPGYETRQSHSLTLVYSGASPDYTGTAVPNIQFDGFSVPDAGLTMLGLVSAAGMRQKLEMLSSVWVIFLTIFWAL